MKILSFVYPVLLSLAVSSSAAQTSPFDANTKWISPGYPEPASRPAALFQQHFNVDKPVAKAVAYITALGLYEASINNKRIGNAWFTPGYTTYNKRLQYQTYDLTNLLTQGKNNILVAVGEGWYRGPFGNSVSSNRYGDTAGLLFHLAIDYKDGSHQDINSDNTWQSGTGPILHSDIYGGELLDNNILPGNWTNVNILPAPPSKLVPTVNEPVVKNKPLKAIRIITTPKGEQVIDFGQNMTGWVRCKVNGKQGDTIRISHAEILDKEGNFYITNLRKAKAEDTYILHGNGPEYLEPHFTFHGFRYARIEGCKANISDFEAIPLHSDLSPAGTFKCSDPMLNQLQDNIVWSLRSNFLDIPTDCPQRSERLGWTGDAQIFFPTAAFNYDVKKFFAKWLQDVAADQYPNGSVPGVIPDTYSKSGRNQGIAGWSDAAVIIPWQIYQVYGDTTVLSDQYSSMKAWVDFIISSSKDYLWNAEGYGDWFAPGPATDLPYINQCYWAYSTQILAETAKLLNKPTDAAYYQEQLEKIKTAFLSHYIDGEGLASSPTQTAYVLALQLQMLPDSLQGKAAKHLANLIQDNNYHLATGFLGTPFLLNVLNTYGYTSLAYRVLNQDTYPSWLYPIKMGATTIWEKWDAIKPDSTLLPVSFNHYAYGAVGNWLYTVVAGISPAAPGYRKIIIKPQPGGGLTWANASYNCPFGVIKSAWKLTGNKLKMTVEIPEGTTATIYVPGKPATEAGPGKHSYSGILPDKI